MTTIPPFLAQLEISGSPAVYHRDGSLVPCPCRTKQGFRDPEWHAIHSSVYEATTPNPPVFTSAVYDQEKFKEWAAYFDHTWDGITSEVLLWVWAAQPPGSLTFDKAEQAPASSWAEASVYLDTEAANYLPEVTRAMMKAVFTTTKGTASRFYYIIDPFSVVENYVTGWVIPPVPPQPHATLEIQAPECNAAGMVPSPISTKDYAIKGFIQPIQSGAVRRLPAEQVERIFGEVKTDDHLGIFPAQWGGHTLDFTNWPQSTKDYISYNGRKFNVVSSNLIPDPSDGNPAHHWEVGLRLISG